MLNLLGEQEPETLKLPSPVPLAVHPAAVYLDSLGSDRSKAAINQMLCTLQRVLKEALRFDLIDPLDYSKAVDVRSIKQSEKLIFPIRKPGGEIQSRLMTDDGLFIRLIF